MTGRHCGDCTLCCRLVPVERISKPANTRCRHQTRRGCAIYQHLPEVVPECRLWSCQWLVDPDAAGLHRPDRVHYVIDLMPDFIGAHDPYGTGSDEVVNVPVMQVWADPQHPHAWEGDTALWRHIEHVAATRRQATLVRIANNRAIAIFAPCLMADHQWHRKESGMAPSGTWTNPLDEMRRVAGLERERHGYSYSPSRDLAREGVKIQGVRIEDGTR